MPNRDRIKIIVFDLLGRELLHYSNTLEKGNHGLVSFSGREKKLFSNCVLRNFNSNYKNCYFWI